MDIIVHSLYSNRDVFLRELISNSADALDKARFVALTDKKALADNPELEIRIRVDPDAGTLEIRDSGVGMTRDDLVNNLGTLARSGTSAFLDALSASAKNGGKGGSSSDSLSLIGQFGVGFYSAFLVADRVQVISKPAGKESQQWAWESAADGAFTVKESDEEGLLEGRGTLVRLFLKDDAAEYKDQHKLRELVGRYSEFVGHPIFLHESKEESREVPLDEKEEEEVEKKDRKKGGDDNEISDGDDDDLDLDSGDDDKSSKKPKTKTVKETVWSWARLNDVKPIWLRAPSDVKDDEHLDFFRAVAKTGPEDSPIARAHFSAEGDVEFRALLYVPATAPFGFYESYYTMEPSVRLYVRRVFVSDSGVVKDIVPRYLGFLRGVVDSDSLPLSVSRETLQASPALKTIKKKVVRKVLDALKKMSDAEASAVAALAERKKASAGGKSGGLFGKKSSTAAAPTKDEAAAIDAYSTLWKYYGRAIKLGLLEDKPNAARLAKLLRFKTSAFPEQKHAANLTSLDAYVSRMQPGQKQIFYLTGEDASALARSPFAERLLEGGFEVLLLDDPVDEYMSQSLTEFDGLKLADASKDGLKLSKDKSSDASSSSDSKDDASSSSSSSASGDVADEKARKQRDKAVRKAFKPLTDWWASPDVLGAGAGVARVRVSPRLVRSPAVVVSSQHGWNANMERIMRAQALAATDAGARAASMRGGRTLEVNPRHGLVR